MLARSLTLVGGTATRAWSTGAVGARTVAPAYAAVRAPSAYAFSARGLKWQHEAKSARAERLGLEPAQLQLPLHPKEKLLETSTPTGWAPPLGTLAELPFSFSRTAQKQLPVYRSYRNGSTRIVTIVRKYRGDAIALKKELQALLGVDAEVELHKGSLQITGDHRAAIGVWLRRLGF